MKVRTFCLFFAAALLLCNCGGKNKKSYDEMGSNGLTTRTENLQTNIRTFAGKGTIIGQEYGTLEGVGYFNDSTRHGDINSITGDYPGCNAYELAGIGEGKKVNVDGISFDIIRKDILDNFKHGCLTILTWSSSYDHEDNETSEKEIKRLADFLSSLQDGYGIKAPVILIPYPLEGKNWYANLNPDAYKKLIEDVIDELKDDDVTNVIFGCSLGKVMAADDFANYVPDGIDVLDYATTDAKTLTQMLPVLASVAQDRNVASGLTVNVKGVKDSTYFSKTILPVIQKYRLSYVCFGANRGLDIKKAQYCVPFPGCSNALIHDFMTLYNDKSSIFRSKLNGLYLKKD